MVLGLRGDEKLAEAWKKADVRRPETAGMIGRYYHAFIKPGKIAPVIHLALLAGALGYVTEYPHIKHELAAEAAAKNSVQ